MGAIRSALARRRRRPSVVAAADADAPPTSPPTEPVDDEDGEPRGCHTDGGLTVAELIAKIGGSTADRPRHHHAAPDPEPPEPDRRSARRRAGRRIRRLRVCRSPRPMPLRCPTWRSAHPSAASAAPTPSRPPCCRKRRSGSRPARLVDDPAADEHPKQKPNRRRHAMMLAGRLMAAAIAALALALTGGAWQWSASKNHRLNTVSALDPQSRDIVDPNAQYGDEDFLIVGMDSRAGANSEMGAGDTEDAGGARSDTVMLVNIPANRKRVVAVSFPRDLAITPIQCEAWNPDTGEYGPLYDSDTKKWGPRNVYTETKLNSTFSFGGPEVSGEGNPEAVRAEHQSLHRHRLRRLRQDGRRARRRGGVQHHSAERLRTGHSAGSLRTPTDRLENRAELRARPQRHHREQRRLRTHQAPAAVLVVAAALADLPGHLLFAEQAQQRRQYVHQATATSTTSRPKTSSSSASRCRACPPATSPS